MRKRSHILTRRHAVALLLASPAAFRSGARALPDPETRLRAVLAAAEMPVQGTVLEVMGFEKARSHGETQFLAIVRMTWRPGLRQRKFISSAQDPERALRQLADTVIETFTNAA